MPSPEGEGRAKDALERTWDSFYAANRAINKPIYAAFPGLKKLVRGQAASGVVDLVGFWLLWRLLGGFDGLQATLGMSRSTIYRRISQFRAVFGEHPDTYEFPGVSVDLAEFVEEFASDSEEEPTI